MGLRAQPCYWHHSHPPACDRLGTNPHCALPVLAALPTQLLPSLVSRQRGAAPQPSAPPPLQRQCKGLSPKPRSLAMGGQPCLAPGALGVTFLCGSCATCMCQSGGGHAVSSLYSNL